MRELDVTAPDGRRLHVYDTGGDAAGVVVWHHGTPNIGPPPAPLIASPLGARMRWIGFDRPGYGGSSPHPDRTIGSVAADVAAIADALGIDRFAVVGHSGGGSHAIGCAAALRDRISAAVSVAGLAPLGSPGLDWFAGMAPDGAASLRAATRGREAKETHEASAGETDPGFSPDDLDALRGEWSWFLSVVEPALADGPGGLIDDDLAYVHAWGVNLDAIRAPVLVVHGGADRVVPVAHAVWLAERIGGAETMLEPAAGHLSVLRLVDRVMEWLSERVAGVTA